MRKNYWDTAYDLETSEQTLALYANWASVYDHEIGHEGGYAMPTRCAAAMREYVSPDGRHILDAGCGTGLSGQALKAAGYSDIHGCDFSSEMLAKADTKNCYGRLFHADLNTKIDSPDSTYDGVACVGVFSFGHVDPDALDEMLRVVKVNGIIVIGLNQKYFEEGALVKKIERLGRQAKAEELHREFGQHLSRKGMRGWVITLRRMR